MVEHRSDFGGGQQPRSRQRNSQQLSHERRLLELQLIQLRSEATAAKLEARAAEVEIMLRRMAMTEAGVVTALDSPSIDHPPIARRPTGIQVQPQFAGSIAATPVVTADTTAAATAADSSVAENTDAAEMIQVLSSDRPSVHQHESRLLDETKPRPGENPFAFLKATNEGGKPSATVSAATSHPPAQERPKPGTSNQPVKKRVSGSSNSKRNCDAAAKIRGAQVARAKPSQIRPCKPDSDTAPPSRRRSRPTAVLFSAAIHGGLLFLLAAISLHVPRPQDQVSLTAVSADSVPEPLATVTVETSEPQVEPTNPRETETEVNFDQMAQVTNVKVASGSLETTPMDSLLNSGVGSASTGARSLSSGSSAEKITFCGVEGGGNHFVYLVDCSKSMGTAFESARAELLHSINALSPQQRFYVIFFDASPDYMRVSQPGVDDPQSVLATAANKQVLRSWAAGIKMDSGEAPYRPLEFALQLRPDVIFLLSDGEFPAGIERLLREENRVDNLFGDQDVKSIVHTISYHSREGEARMRAIASQNQGQYRYVPKPLVAR